MFANCTNLWFDQSYKQNILSFVYKIGIFRRGGTTTLQQKGGHEGQLFLTIFFISLNTQGFSQVRLATSSMLNIKMCDVPFSSSSIGFHWEKWRCFDGGRRAMHQPFACIALRAHQPKLLSLNFNKFLSTEVMADNCQLPSKSKKSLHHVVCSCSNQNDFPAVLYK